MAWKKVIGIDPADGQPGGGQGTLPPPTRTGAQPQQTQPSGLRPPGIEQPHSTGTIGDVNMPADTSRPQTWRDWWVRNYNPSPRDWANVFGDAASYHMIPLGTAGVEKASDLTGVGVPSDYGSASQRAALEQSRRNLGPSGPFVTAAGYMLSPATYLGVGPAARTAAGVADAGLAKYLPTALQRFVAPATEAGTTSAITGASQTAGGGGSLWDTIKSAGENFPIGAGFGILGTAASGKGQSAADITEKTQAEADAAKTNLEQMRFKDPGIKIQGKTPQTEAEFQDALDWAKNISPSEDPLGGAPVVASKLQSVLDQPGPQAAIDASNAAATRAANAAQLQRMQATADVPGADIRGQARTAMEALDPSSAEFDAFKKIATAPETGKRPWWLTPAQTVAETAPTLAGDAFGYLRGLHGLGFGGQLGGKAVSMGMEKAFGPKPTTAPLSSAISDASQPLTGYAVQPPGNPMATSNPLMNIYQNLPPFSLPQDRRALDISNYTDTMM